MARKNSPTISKRGVAVAALDIVDREGTDRLTVRELAKSLGVSGPSLYHHYRDRNEILEDVARLALEGARLPVMDDTEWKVWLMRSNIAYLQALLAHPNVMPIVVTSQPRRSREIVAEYMQRSLEREGVSASDVPAISRYVEAFVIGIAMGRIGDTRLRTLRRAELVEFEEILSDFIDTLVTRARARAGRRPGGRNPNRNGRRRAVAAQG